MEASGISVVISHRNQSGFLRAVLRGLAGQTWRNSPPPSAFQIVICDDRSDKEEVDRVKATVNEMIGFWSSRGIELTLSLYQGEDFEGWAKGACLNKGVREHAVNDLLMFLDGDCIPAANWAESHWLAHHQRGPHYFFNPMIPGVSVFTPGLGERNFYVGSRFFIHEDKIQRAIDFIEAGDLESLYVLSRGTALWCSVTALGFGYARMQGCNWSVFKPYFLEVGGFKEGKEGGKNLDDSVMWHQLCHAHIIPRPTTDAIVYHLGDKEYDEWRIKGSA